MDTKFVFGAYFMGIVVEGEEYDDGHVVVMENADESFLAKLKERGYDVSGKGTFAVLIRYKNDFEPMLKKAWVRTKKYTYEDMVGEFLPDDE